MKFLRGLARVVLAILGFAMLFGMIFLFVSIAGMIVCSFLRRSFRVIWALIIAGSIDVIFVGFYVYIESYRSRHHTY